jgi:hypothetical protein
MSPNEHDLTTSDESALHAARHNVALYHREHMRFNATTMLELAADISREADRLKIFGDYWQRPEEPPRTASFDISDPRFGATGCSDLNPLNAIAGAGILFMEGVGEPDEIRMLKEKLQSEGTRYANKGQWLAEAMRMTWQSDVVLLDPATPDAWPWISIVSATLRSAKQRSMAGSLLLVAREYLEKVDFTPAAIRANRAASGKLLLLAARTMDAAAAVFSDDAAGLRRGELEWAEYLAYFGEPTPR